MSRIVTLTGHRDLSSHDRTELYQRVFNELVGAGDTPWRAELVLSGMAIGFDLLGTEVCRELGIPYEAYVPFLGQTKYWGPSDQAAYERAMLGARRVVVVSKEYWHGAYHERDRCMVDAGTEVLAFLGSKRTKSGTGYTVSYANKLGRKVTNVW